MSLAWSGIVLLLLLLPGVLFFVGLYFPERFTRDIVQRSLLGQLAGTLLISFVVHAVLYLLTQKLCGFAPLLRCIDLGIFFGILGLDGATAEARRVLAGQLAEAALPAASYIVIAAGSGTLLGWLTGTMVVHGKLRFLVPHTWLYQLQLGAADAITVAYVMTHVMHERRILMYKGFLSGFGLQRDGRFAYLVLTDVSRYYMLFEDAGPTTTVREQWKSIGASAEPRRSLFVIEGEDIANVVFDRYPLQSPTRIEDVNRMITQVRKDLAKEGETRQVIELLARGSIPGRSAASKATPAQPDDHLRH